MAGSISMTPPAAITGTVVYVGSSRTEYNEIRGHGKVKPNNEEGEREPAKKVYDL